MSFLDLLRHPRSQEEADTQLRFYRSITAGVFFTLIAAIGFVLAIHHG
jgi:hypothetical protein